MDKLSDALDKNRCAVCGTHVFGSQGGVPLYYCDLDYAEHKEAILAGLPWIKFLYREEKNRRRRRSRRWKHGAIIEVPLGEGRYA